MNTLALERVQPELILFGITHAMILLPDIVLGVEHLVDAPLLLSLHEDLNVLRLDLLQHRLIITIVLLIH